MKSNSTSDVKVSVVLPNFNDAKYIARAIESVIKQTHQVYELIIIDDASTDNSVDIMQQYADKHSFIKIHRHLTNLGTIKTMHESLQLVTGTHMAFLAADDWFLPDFLASAMNMFRAHPQIAFWSCGSWSVTEDKVDELFPTAMNYPTTQQGLISTSHAAKMLYKIDSWFCGNTVVYNTDIIRAEFGPNVCLNSFADNFLYRVLACKYGCGFTPQRLSVWRIRKGSMSHTTMSHSKNLLNLYTTALDLADSHYPNVFSKAYMQRMRARFMFDVAKSIWINTNYAMSDDLKRIIKDHSPNKFKNFLTLLLFRFASNLPVARKNIGLLAGYLHFRAFDLCNIIKIRTVQQFKT